MCFSRMAPEVIDCDENPDATYDKRVRVFSSPNVVGHFLFRYLDIMWEIAVCDDWRFLSSGTSNNTFEMLT